MKVICLQCGNLVGGGGRGAEAGAQVPDHPGHPHSWERAMALEVEKSGWTCSRQKREDLLDTPVGGGTIAPFRIQDQHHLNSGTPAGRQTAACRTGPTPPPLEELDKYLLN